MLQSMLFYQIFLISIDHQRRVKGLTSKLELCFLDMKNKEIFDNTLNLKNPVKIKWYSLIKLFQLAGRKINRRFAKVGIHPSDELEFPTWNISKQRRDNFILISPYDTLEQVKESMISKNMSYAVITKEECILGVLNYSLFI